MIVIVCGGRTKINKRRIHYIKGTIKSTLSYFLAQNNLDNFNGWALF